MVSSRSRAMIAAACVLLLIMPWVAALELPANIASYDTYNTDLAKDYQQNLNFLIAFVAGMLSILSPCSISLFPAFFAYTFKEKSKITGMTILFFLGFSLIFVTLGLVATYIGDSILILQSHLQWLVFLFGFIFILLGLMTIFGNGFGGIRIPLEKLPIKRSSALGVFLFGASY